MLPGVRLIQTNNNLGRVEANADGVAAIIGSGIAVGATALGDVLGPFLSLQDVEDFGITAAYDSTNQCCMHLHASDFYEQAGKGAKLYLMVVANTITMAQMTNQANAYCKKLIEHNNNEIKLIGVTRVPQSGYTPNYVDQFDDDIWAAITNAQALRDFEFEEPNFNVSQFFIEGRDWQGTVSTSRDLRASFDSNRVSLCMCQNPDVIVDYTWAQKYASVGAMLGRAAAIPVQRNIGRVKNDRVLGFVNAGYSNGTGFESLTDTERDLLDERGYIFLRRFKGKVGFYFNDDHTCTKLTDDYYSIGRGRTIDKASQLALTVLTEYTNDDVPVDAVTGKLPLSVIKQIQGNTESYVQNRMVDEISGVEAFIDPEQDILTSDELALELDIIPKGITKHIVVRIGYRNPNIQTA